MKKLYIYLKNKTISNEDWQVAIQTEYDDKTINIKNHLLNAFELVSLSEYEIKILSHFSVLPTLHFSGKELLKLFSVDEKGQFNKKKNSNGLTYHIKHITFPDDDTIRKEILEQNWIQKIK